MEKEFKKSVEEKSAKLISMFERHVNGYVGSSFMTGTEFPNTIKSNATSLALIFAKDMANEWDEYNTLVPDEFTSKQRTFWFYVFAELEQIKKEISN